MDLLAKIDQVLDERYPDDYGRIRVYDDDDVCVTDAIRDVLMTAGLSEDEFDIQRETLFSSPAEDVGYVSIAFIENGKLQHVVYEYR